MKHKNLIFLIVLLFGVSVGLFAQTNALDFDGNDHVAFGNLGFAGTTYTTEAWIYPTSLVTTEPQYCNTIFGASTSAGNYPMWVGTNGSEIRIWSYSPIGTYWQTTGLGLVINTWYHVAITATKGGNTTLYVNGQVKRTFTNPGSGVNWTTAFCVGDLRAVPPRGIGFKGKIADVRVWDNILSQAQIQYGMNNDLVGDEAGLIGYWPFHEGSGTTVQDHTTPAHNGTLGANPYDPAWTSGQASVNLASNNPAVAASMVPKGTDKHPIYRFTLTGVGAAAVLNSVTFTTAGTYVANDVDNFKLWYNSADNLGGATQIGSSIVAALGTGSHTFSGLTQAIGNGSTEYFWITTDVTVSATPLNVISVDAITTGGLTLGSGFKTGIAYAAGDQTIDQALPVELSSFTAVLTVENYVTVKWITQSETGVSGYYIYRSMDNDWANAEKISDMIASANSPIQQVYQYTDNELEEDGTYYYWLQAQDLTGHTVNHGPTSIYFSNTGGTPETPPVAPIAGINNIYPNPITPYSVISYTLTKAADVKFKVYNSRGQLINSFSEGYKTNGEYNTGWNGKDSNGKECPVGVYYIKLQAGKYSAIRKAVIIK